MEKIELRLITGNDRWSVADLIFLGTNYWSGIHLGRPTFTGGSQSTVVFFDVYEGLDPGCGVVAEDVETGSLAGVCFYHPRPSHVSLGYMCVHPGYVGLGIAKRMMRFITDFADENGKPVRLVSSALNLDSYSLYTRGGFVPRGVYQDMLIPVPEGGLKNGVWNNSQVRDAGLKDVGPMVALEKKLAGLEREKDFRYFLENKDGFWHVSVYENQKGEIEGFIVSSAHKYCNFIGPGAATTARQAVQLILGELDLHRGRTPLVLIPVMQQAVVRELYGLGARNCELHFSQVRGDFQPIQGVTIPTFLPESS